MTKAAEMICDILIEAGIEYVFGIPGGATTHIWNAFFDRQDRIKTVLTRHEQSAACMADMYGRMTGKPGVLMGQGAFIASSGGFGIIEGYLSSSPMLILTDTSEMGPFSQHGNCQSGTGEYGSFDLCGMFRAMSKWTTYAATPKEAVQGVQFAIKHAMVGKPGPACVVMRTDAIVGEVDPQSTPKIYPTSGYMHSSFTIPPLKEVEKAVQSLLKAHSPVLIAGNGVHVSKAYEELKELAELLEAPVATSANGKSSFPEIHPLALGMMGNFGQKIANEIIAEADLLLVAGCSLSPSDTGSETPRLIDPARQKILQIDIDPRNAGWTFPVEMSLIGDLKLVLREFIEAIKSKGPLAARRRAGMLQERKLQGDFYEAPEIYANDSPILPQRLVKEIERAVDPSTTVILDAGNNRLWMSHFFKCKEVRTVISPGGNTGMGWGPAAALTVKLLHPDRPVLSVSGDGGFAMVTHVLSTAVQHHLPVTFLVMNNSCLGRVRDFQKDKIIGSEFVDTDFAQIAKAFGCLGIRIKKADELAPALEEALRTPLPCVLDVITSTSEPFFKIDTLSEKPT